jgi:hypothetical protein
MGHLLNMALKGKSAAGIATVYWSHFYNGTCSTRSWSVSKNSVVIASGNGNSMVSGSFTVANGDTISVSETTGASGSADCINAFPTIYRDATLVASDTKTGVNVTATASWTIATVQAIYYINGGIPQF